MLNLPMKDSLSVAGFTMIPFPSSLRRVYRQAICDYLKLSPAATNEELTQAVCSYSEEQFAQKLAKPMRYFSDSVTAHALEWVQSLSEMLGGSQLGINYVSPHMIEHNPKLTEHSIDCFWRCVRPNKPDIGQPHRDSQFWAIEQGTDLQPKLPFDYDERWKIWVPLFGCDAQNSLQIVPKSHHMEVPCGTVETENGQKPTIDAKWVEEQEWLCPLTQFDGSQCILFHDDLVHRGPASQSPFVRISSELTILLVKS